jgi:hypothetical protein
MSTSLHAHEPAADVTVTSHAGLFVLRPETARGRTWLETHCAAESYQWINGELAVDGREYAEAIAEALTEAGFVVR